MVLPFLDFEVMIAFSFYKGILERVLHGIVIGLRGGWFFE
jgi:hypothetical protein